MIMRTSFRVGAVCIASLALAVGCHRNFDWFDEAESALGKPTGHDAKSAGMAPYKGQRTCPVSGEKLGAHGSPVPVKLKGEMIYVCCASCVEKAKDSPDACIARVKAERAKTAVMKPVAVDLGPFNGQTHCPVSGDELDPETARDLVVKKERIWVCCNDCAVRARANFDKYFPKVKAERDAALAAVMAKQPLPDEGKPATSNDRTKQLTKTSEAHGPAPVGDPLPDPDTGDVTP
jgi:hypothetical protein